MIDGTTRSLAGTADVYGDVAFYNRRLTEAAAEDHVFDVAAYVLGTYRTAGDLHLGSTFQHTVLVAAAIDGRLHLGLGVVAVLDGHRGRAEVLGHHILRVILVVMPQTATEDAAFHRTGVDVDLRFFACKSRDGVRIRVFVVVVVLLRVHGTEGRSAIDIARDGTRAGIGDTWLCDLRADVHRHVTADHRGLTLTATVDIVADRSAGHVYFGIAEHVGRIAAAIDIGNGVLSSFRCFHILNLHQRVLVHGRLVTTTKHTAVNLAVVLHGQIGLEHLAECGQILTGYDVILTVFGNKAIATF